MTTVELNGKKVRLSGLPVLGEGGEAVVYDMGATALKIYRQPGDEWWKLQPPGQEQRAAERLTQHQMKLAAFPKNLPDSIVGPKEMAFDGNGLIVGYAMPKIKNAQPLLMYTDRDFRQAVDPDEIGRIFLDMWETDSALHQAGVVIGDHNDANKMVPATGNRVYYIDVDSMQYGTFACRLYTTKLVDPLLCSYDQDMLQMVRAHTPESDWYSYCAMLFECCTFTGVYSGIHRPKDRSKRCGSLGQRVANRISVLNAEVGYPMPATPLNYLPDELLQHFYSVFEKQYRGVFPRVLLENLRWTKCSVCDAVHARRTCPVCTSASPEMIKQTIAVHGTITSNTFFRTKGFVAFCKMENGALKYVYHEGGKFFREGAREVFATVPDRQMRYRICNKKTLVGKDNRMIVFDEFGKVVDNVVVDRYQEKFPVFDANSSNYYWISGGKLYHNAENAPTFVCDVLSGSTNFWVGEKFGFGYYRVGNATVGFVFETERPIINDKIDLPAIKGQVRDALALFSSDQCWFIYSVQEGPDIKHYCHVIGKDGKVLASHEAIQGDGSWLGTLRGKFASGKTLFAATDEGVVRLEVQNAAIVISTEFPDSKPFVDSSCGLFADSQGLTVTKANQISALQIKRQ